MPITPIVPPPSANIETVGKIAGAITGLGVIIAVLRRRWRAICASIFTTGRAELVTDIELRERHFGWTLAALEWDADQPAPRLRPVVERVFKDTMIERETNDEANAVANAVTDRKVDALTNAQAALAKALEPLSRLPDFAARIESHVTHIAERIDEVRTEQTEQGRRLQQHGEDIARWQTGDPDRRGAGDTDRRGETSRTLRGGGRRRQDDRPA